jgi:hypothetical protein
MLFLMICRSKLDPIQIDRLANRNQMKTASTSIDIVNGACQRKDVLSMTEDDLDATNRNPSKDTVCGDSWFSSVDLVEKMSENYIGVVKTNHSRYPKVFLQSKMQNWPAGSHLLLRTVLNKSRRNEKVIFALGYKYSKAKVLFFIFNEGAGHTECLERNAYEAKWKDKNLNTLTRMIPRPQVCHQYFQHCNMIDVHNQSRQDDLALERHWVTQNGHFRIVTTIFGMTVVDAWKGYIWHCGKNHRHKKVKLLGFVDMLCKDMLTNEYSNGDRKSSSVTYSICTPTTSKKRPASIDIVRNNRRANGELLNEQLQDDENASYILFNDSQVSDMTSLSDPIEFDPNPPPPPIRHCLTRTDETEPYMYGSGEKKKLAVRTMRRKCIVCKKNKTPFYCSTCMKGHTKSWVCAIDSNCMVRHCHEIHYRGDK